MTGLSIDVSRVLYLHRVERKPYVEIAREMGVPASRVLGICRYGFDVAWLSGLSVRGAHAVIKSGAKSREELAHKIDCENYDLEDLGGVGHKTAFEVHKWTRP